MLPIDAMCVLKEEQYRRRELLALWGSVRNRAVRA